MIVVSDDVGHSSMLASVELKKREKLDDIDFFLQMKGFLPCGIISI
jgi:hypothetical protein